MPLETNGANGDISSSYEPRDSLQTYLHEAGRTPLLTPQQEVALAHKIKTGDERARNYMIRANLRLVVKIARDYEGMGVPLLDLINEGNIGLMKAVDRFNPTRGAKLSTYAALWIKQCIRRALSNSSRTIRLPVHLVDKMARMRHASMRLSENLGREPDDEELAAELGTTPRRVRSMFQSFLAPIPLDAPIDTSDNQSGSISDLIADPNSEAADNIIGDSEDKDVMRHLVSKLTERERLIITRRFGLDGTKPQTLEEIGDCVGVTRERIRQIEAQALNKLERMLAIRNGKKPPPLLVRNKKVVSSHNSTAP